MFFVGMPCMMRHLIFHFIELAVNLLEFKGQGLTSVADPHRKNADADPGKNLSVDADSYPY
jgi:hypothetical protein